MPSRSSIRGKRTGSSKFYKTAVTTTVAAAALLSIAFLLIVNGDVLLRFALAIVVLIVSGRMIATANGISNSYGAYLLGGKRGIKLIDKLATKNPKMWSGFADWGLAFSFGILSYFVFRNQVSKRMVVLGVATICAVLLLAFPYLPLVLSFINIPQISASVAASAQAPQGLSAFFYIFLAISVIGGFSLSTIFLILYSGGSILYTTFLFLSGLLSSHPNYSILTQQVPGVAPLIPGLTIPLFAGIISLFILLVVHEFSHGVLARIVRVRIKSIGAIFFGIIPMGAFVEPDEKEVKRLKSHSQNRISIAGVSANMLTCIVFFAFTLVLLYLVLPNISTGGVLVTQVVKGYPAYGVIAPNTTILKWDNTTISNSYDLTKAEAVYTPNTLVTLVTDKGAYQLTPTASGKLGISGAPAQATYAYQASNFLYAVAALSFGLNFFVAIFNLLPIPGFDGWRIYENKIRNKRTMKVIAMVLVIAILLNVLPWFWTIS
ncbi:MAG: site-2 protease family protein [Candidatus Micrarchaeota archaeon]|nr:site-2 protease family protein [Candidatus Micrarchaeota archaeon]